MSNNDLWIRDVITSYGLLMFVFIIVVILISRKWSNLKKRTYKAYLTGFEVECAELMIPYKKLLFKSLQHVVSGENIQFYPDSTRLIGVDRNLRLPEYLIKGNRSWQFSHIIIERLIVGDGSCLKEVPTGCVDAVVTTRSLCSVISLQSTLREIHRVLAPGGQYVFIEHIPENGGTLLRWLQKFLSQTKIWPSLFGGCHLDIDPVVNIKSAGFNHITWDIFTLDGYVSHPFHLILSRQHVLGMAIR